MKWRYVLATSSLVGLAYFLPFAGLPEIGDVVRWLLAFLIGLVLYSAALGGALPVLRRLRAERLSRRWVRAIESDAAPAGARMAARPASLDLLAGLETGDWPPLAGGPARLEHAGGAMARRIHELCGACPPRITLQDADWILTAASFAFVAPGVGLLLRFSWEELEELRLLRPVRLSRGVEVVLREGGSLHLRVDARDAPNLEAVASALRRAALPRG